MAARSWTTGPGWRDRDDPDTLALPRGRERLRRRLVRAPPGPRGRHLRGDQAPHPGDRPLRAQRARVPGGTSLAPSRVWPTRSTAAAAGRPTATDAGPARRERRGGRPRLLRARRLRREPEPGGWWPGRPTSTATRSTRCASATSTAGHDLTDTIERTYYGTAWSADERHLFYVVPDDAMRPFQVWRHELGTAQADDVLVLQEDDERFYVGLELSRSERSRRHLDRQQDLERDVVAPRH